MMKYFFRSILPNQVIGALSSISQKKSLINGLRWMSIFQRTQLVYVDNLHGLGRTQKDKLFKNAMFYDFFPANYPVEKVFIFFNLAMKKGQRNEKNDLIRSLEIERLSLKNLFRLYALSINFGKFINAYEIRQFIYQKAIRSKNLDRRLLILENNNNNNNENVKFHVDGNINSYFSSLFSNSNVIENHLKAKEVRSNYIDYGRFLKEQTVALVGPSKSNNTNNGREIDSFDVVVRFNDTKIVKKNPDISGLRCDVSYFNNVGVDVFIKTNDRALWSPTLEWAVFYDKSNLNDLTDFFGSKKPATKFRLVNLFEADDCLLHGSLNGIQRVIFDLLFFQPKSIKVFNSDLMLNPIRSDGYRSHSDKEIENDFIKNGILNMASPHDPYSNFQFLKKMYDKEYFDADETLSEILSGSVYDYMQNLEKVYGDGVGY